LTKNRFGLTGRGTGRLAGVVFGVIFFLLPLVLRNPYHLHLLIMAGMNAVLAMTFVFLLRTGLISIAIAAFWGIGAYASALLAVKLHMPFCLTLPLSTIAAGLVAWLTGFILVRRPGFSFIIQTMVFSFIIVLVFGNFDFFGRYAGIFNIPRPDPIHLPFYGSVDFTSKVPFYYLMLVLLLLIGLAFRAFYAAWSGRACRAIDLSPRLAESLGVNLFRYRLLAFVVASGAAGLMGSFFAHFYGSVVPSTFDAIKTINVQVYAILGGIQFAFVGPVIGSLLMTLVPEVLRITKEVEPVFTGLLVILLAMFLPDGILGLVSAIGRGKVTPPRKNIGRLVSWVRSFMAPGVKGRG
jgi:branched-chain amino acid transport system permease protein